ncbi:hypothetical protein VULLAG_LOCUS3373 [Vulpes lagopus]
MPHVWVPFSPHGP